MNPRPRLNADFLWECPVCHRPYHNPQCAADCACPAKKPPAVAAPLVRCSELLVPPTWSTRVVTSTAF